MQICSFILHVCDVRKRKKNGLNTEGKEEGGGETSMDILLKIKALLIEIRI